MVSIQPDTRAFHMVLIVNNAPVIDTICRAFNPMSGLKLEGP